MYLFTNLSRLVSIYSESRLCAGAVHRTPVKCQTNFSSNNGNDHTLREFRSRSSPARRKLGPGPRLTKGWKRISLSHALYDTFDNILKSAGGEWTSKQSWGVVADLLPGQYTTLDFLDSRATTLYADCIIETLGPRLGRSLYYLGSIFAVPPRFSIQLYLLARSHHFEPFYHAFRYHLNSMHFPSSST